MTEPVTNPSSMAEPPSRPSNLRVVPSRDMLAEVFAGQSRLMERYHDIEAENGSPVLGVEQLGDLDDRQVQARLHQLFGYAIREWSEAMQELRNKPWKRTGIATDRDAFVNEVGDVLHFFVEFCITSGISAEELHARYFQMHAKNQERQNSGY